MITYKNLRDAHTAYDGKLFDLITTLTVDVYQTKPWIMWWYSPKFIKTVKLIRVYNVWRDLDNKHLPIDNISQLEILLNKYESTISKQNFEDLLIGAINNYKDNRCTKI